MTRLTICPRYLTSCHTFDFCEEMQTYMPSSSPKTGHNYVSSSSPNAIVRFLRSIDISDTVISQILTSSIEALDNVDFRLPIDDYIKLWEFAIEASDCPELGLRLGASIDEEDIGILGHIFFSNANIRQALEQYRRYFCIANDCMDCELFEANGKVHLSYQCKYPQYYCVQDIERTIAAGICRTRDHLGRSLPLEYIAFEHSEPDYSEVYHEIFGCPVEFSSPTTEIVFDKKYLDFKLPHRSSYLQKVLAKHLESLLGKLKGKHSFRLEVEKVIRKRLSKSAVDANQIAKQLNMSRNTMYRKLAQEGLTFQDLVDGVRKQKATEYLAESKYSLSQIAFLLGFSELSAFSRAFKRWTGLSPAKYLEQHKDEH